jgi:hypothetical protein
MAKKQLKIVAEVARLPARFPQWAPIVTRRAGGPKSGRWNREILSLGGLPGKQHRKGRRAREDAKPRRKGKKQMLLFANRLAGGQ